MEDKQIDDIAAVFKAMGEPSRLLLLRHLMEEAEASVGELAEACGLSHANAGKHLKLLSHVNLISPRREGTAVFYRITDPFVRKLCTLCSERVAEERERLRRELLAE